MSIFSLSLALVFFFLFFSAAPLPAGFPELIISVLAACLWQGSLAGRKAGRWPLRSWVIQVRCWRCPWGASVSYLCGMPENTLATSPPAAQLLNKVNLHTLGTGRRFQRACGLRTKGFAIIRNNMLGFWAGSIGGQPAFHSLCISKHRCFKRHPVHKI